jgi:hypothetical protein
MKQSLIRSVLILTVLVIAFIKVTGQAVIPDILIKNTLNEQLKYIEEKTRIYEDYRAIREDMFQKIKSNVSDTLSAVNNKISELNKMVSSLSLTIDTLRKNLKSTESSLDEMTRSKNSISLFGFELNKSDYNKIMWTIIAGLSAALIIGFLVFKRNLSVLFSTKNEFQELKNEFEAYRKTSREAREKLTMDHFNEIKRLKG